MKPNIQTLGALKQSDYQSKSIKAELRQNLIQHIQSKNNVFEGIEGYESSVIPELQRAILSGHNINLLGLRGQAKTKLARMMTLLLDEWIPVVKGSEINDDPLHPISAFSKELINEKGDDCPIDWLHRSERFSEKLATPDVTVSDLIGDVDPIKAANLKLAYSNEKVIHFGMIPRANRCIFVINELPDLQARIQVSLFNILQEGDIQIRGFKLRMPLDIQFVFTANPEDYTNRGSIVTPLKDRIGSQILTHYPQNTAIARKITFAEAKISQAQSSNIYVPDLAYELIEQIVFEARQSTYIDEKSGVSARVSISCLENLMSTAELRKMINQEPKTSIRLSDFLGVIPSITGKVELVYEGEQEGAAKVAIELIELAVQHVFLCYFPRISKLEKQGVESPYQELIDFFMEGNEITLFDDLKNKDYNKTLSDIKPLNALIEKYMGESKIEDHSFIAEIILWALASNEKLSKDRMRNKYEFKDSIQSYLKDL